MQILLFITIGFWLFIVAVLIVHCTVQAKRYKHFLTTAKPGDTCRFYTGDEAHQGIIITRDDSITTVKSIATGNIIDILTINTYPSW